MAEETKKAVCEKCGAEVREGTTFCYSCGGQIASAATATLTPTQDPLPGEEPLKTTETLDKTSNTRLSEAAEQRRKARVSQRKSNEYSWEATDDTRLTLLIAVLITVIALAIAFLAVRLK